MRRLQPGWYIVLYHDVSWEENCYVRSIGGTCPPDLFRRHVLALAEWGDLVAVEEGERLLREEALDRPVFSVWFDDGLAGVYRYAMPILDEAGVPAAVSICSRFVDRSEFFWRYKLSYLKSIDGMRFLRSRLKKHGFRFGDSVKNFTLDRFSPEIVDAVDALFVRFTTADQRRDAYRTFLDRERIRRMHDRGWTIANHTGGHYPVSQAHSLSMLCSELGECEAAIREICGGPSSYWVLPFDRRSSPDTVRVADACREGRTIVFVGNRRNTPGVSNAERVLYRFRAPVAGADRLRRILSG